MSHDDPSRCQDQGPGYRAPLGLVSLSSAEVDWSAWYLTDEDDMGEGLEQHEIVRVLLSCITEWARERGWTRRLWAGDQFFAWNPEHPLVRVSPDVYLLDDPPPRPGPKSWQTWLPGHHAPTLAVEIVSEDWKKDYEENPHKYAQLGCRELVIFDPEAAVGSTRGSERVALQVFGRQGDGVLSRRYQGPGPVFSEVLEAFWVVCTEDLVTHLRLARDLAGKDLVPTEAEARQREAEARQREAEARQREAEARQREAEARQREAEARQREAEARQHEAEARQREAEARKRAEERVAELEALLRLRGPDAPR